MVNYTTYLILDSGSDVHSLSSREHLDNYCDRPLTVTAFGGTKITLSGFGRCSASVLADGKLRPITIPRVEVLEKGPNLASVAELTNLGYDVVFKRTHAELICRADGSTIRCERKHNHYFLALHHSSNAVDAIGARSACYLVDNSEGSLLRELTSIHRSMAHMSGTRMLAMTRAAAGRRLVLRKPVRDLLQRLVSSGTLCESCAAAKGVLHTLPGSSKTTKYHQPDEAVSIDFFTGPGASRTLKFYTLLFVDIGTTYLTPKFVARRSEASSLIIDYVKAAKNRGRPIRVLKMDNAAEFLDHDLIRFLECEGIHIQPCGPHKHGQNGHAERNGRTIKEHADAILSDSRMPVSFWQLVFEYFVYTHNRYPTARSSAYSPYELYMNRYPDPLPLLPFGCRMVTSLPEGERRTLLRSKPQIFVGYGSDHKDCYSVYNPKTQRVTLRHYRDCSAFPTIIPLRLPDPAGLTEPGRGTDSEYHCLVCKELFTTQDMLLDHLYSKHAASIAADLGPAAASASLTTSTTQAAAEEDFATTTQGTPEQEISSTSGQVEDEQKVPKRRSARRRNPVNNYDPAAWRAQQLHDKWRHKTTPSVDVLLCAVKDDIEPEREYTIAKPYWVLHLKTPSNYDEAISDEHYDQWVPSIEKEINSLIELKVWDEKSVPLPKGAKAVRCKFIFKDKFDENGQHLKSKSRLVALGFSTIANVHYHETFAPVAHSATLRLVMLYALKNHLPLELMDVTTAFLYADLAENEVVYMQPPPGMNMPKGHVLRLRKAIYGLKNAGFHWCEHLKSTLLGFDFQQCSADPCLFIHKTNGQIDAIIGAYVDDLTMAGVRGALDRVKVHLCEKYSMKDLGATKHLLGVKVDYDITAGTLKLSQTTTVDNLLDRFGMADCNPSKTPAHEVRLRKRPTDQDPKIRAIEADKLSAVWGVDFSSLYRVII
jgi:hypothetical protein